MQLTVQGKQIDVGDALRTHVQEKLDDINAKYFNRAIDANVHFNREGQGFFRAHIAIRVGKNIQIMGEAIENDIYLAFDVAAAKVAKQLRRYKNRLRSHHRRIEETPETEIMKAQAYVLAMGQDEDRENDSSAADTETHTPLIIAEMTSESQIETLSVSEAVMRMDLAHQTFFLFRNAKHGGLNVVYRRDDGNIGWVDPAEDTRLQQAAE